MMDKGRKNALSRAATFVLKAVVQAILIAIIRTIIDHFSSP
jgi:hypothetical protein